MSDTPETDAEWKKLQGYDGEFYTGCNPMSLAIGMSQKCQQLERQRNELCDALQEALKRMEHLEGWKNGTKVTLPTCECAIEYAKEVIAKAKGETL